jgi:transposase
MLALGRGENMMGESEGQPTFYYNMSLEQFVPQDHPLRSIRPFIDKQAIRRECRSLYSTTGRPSIPPEQLFLALVGGYLLGITSDRKLIMELQCNMALRWFVGLGLEEQPWDASTFSQNRRRRFDRSGVLERLFDQTVKRAMKENLISRHVSADGTLVRANASFKSFVPIEVAMDPEEYKKRLRSSDEEDNQGPQDPGNPKVDFRGEKRGNKTHRSVTDPDCRFVSKGSSGTGAYPGYTVNALMENRSRILLGVGVEIFRSSTSEEEGALCLLDRARRRLRFRAQSLGADKGYFHKDFIEGVFQRKIEPHIAADARGSSRLHMRVRMRRRGFAYRMSQRCRKKIEELFGEGKEYHGLRRFRRRTLFRVREETWLIGWVLNLKRLARLLTVQPTQG